MAERTYNLKVSCELVEVENGETNPIQNVVLEELDLNYEQVLGLQEVILVPMVNNLIELGKLNLKSKSVENKKVETVTTK
jgi:hypothetical protein